MKKNISAFTLIELLVVVLIIGILAAIALPQYTAAVERSKVSEAMASLGTLVAAQQRYFMENNAYTNIPDNLDVIPPGTFTATCARPSGTECYETKNFIFQVFTDGTAAAYRKGPPVGNSSTPGPYAIAFYSVPLTSNGITYNKECVDTSGGSYALSKKICTSIGGKFRDGTTWRHYAL